MLHQNDNTTPMPAAEYDENINRTIPYYNEFYVQTFDVVTQCGYSQLDWLDLGCGTGILEEKAFREFPSARFTAVDPSFMVAVTVTCACCPTKISIGLTVASTEIPCAIKQWLIKR